MCLPFLPDFTHDVDQSFDGKAFAIRVESTVEKLLTVATKSIFRGIDKFQKIFLVANYAVHHELSLFFEQLGVCKFVEKRQSHFHVGGEVEDEPDDGEADGVVGQPAEEQDRIAKDPKPDL